MNLIRSVCSVLLIMLVVLPLTAGAQTSDEIIADLLRTLDGTTPVRVVSTSTASTTAPKPAPKPVSYSTAVPTPTNQPVLGPMFVFGIDGNATYGDLAYLPENIPSSP